MSIFNLFHKKSDPGEIKLFFNFGDTNVVHSNNISKEVHTKKKYYHEAFCAGTSGTGKGVKCMSNVAMYIAASYVGTNLESLHDTIKSRQVDFAQGRYPVSMENAGHYAIWLKDVAKHCTDIHAEVDHKDGQCMTKFIFHCADNENDIDIYLVVYSDSMDWAAKNYLLNPDWVK